MHDHQSDWKSTYLNLDDMNDTDDLHDPLTGDDSARSLITSQQLNHAKSVFRQMKQKALESLNQVTDLKPKNLQVAQMKINDLCTRAEIALQNVDYQIQITDLVHKTKLQLYRIIIIKKLTGKINSIINNLKSDLLTKDQQDAASSEMKSIVSYTHQDLIKAQTITSIKNSYVSGVNSANGALVKYVVDGQINIADQVRHVAAKVHHEIENQTDLNVASKYMAYQQIDTIKADLTSNLMSAGTFAELKRIRQNVMDQLNSILSDKDEILKDLTNFNRFINKIQGMLSTFLQLPAGVKLQLEQRISDYQKRTELQVQQRHSGNSQNRDFDLYEHDLATMVIDTLIKACRRMLSKQKMKMTSGQQSSLNNKLQSTILKIQSDFDQSHLKGSIEDSLAAGIKQLNEIAKKIHALVYQNQIEQFTDDINSRIDLLYGLSDKDRAHLKARIKIIKDHLADNSESVTVLSAKHRLYGFFNKQSHQMVQASISQVFNDMYKQIQESHLSMDQTHQFLNRLLSIRRKSNDDYESQHLLLKNVMLKSLVVDKNNNLRRMTKLNEDFHHQINSFDIVSQLDELLRQDLIDYSQRINSADQLSVADQEEQKFESLAYHKLYRLYAGTDSPQANALQTVIVTADGVYRYVDAAVLDPQVNGIINEKISHHVNTRLHHLLTIHDSDKLKNYVVKVVKFIKSELLQAVSDLRTAYVAQTDHRFKSLGYQLKAYSVKWNFLDKMDVIHAKAVKRIRLAKGLLKIEYAMQLGEWQANQLLSEVVTRSDRDRQIINHKIDTLIKIIDTSLAKIERATGKVNYELSNRILRIENQAKFKINQSLKADLTANYRHYSQILGQILRRVYLREWLLSIKRAHTTVKGLANVPAGAKSRALKSIQDLKLKTMLKLQKCDQTTLKKTLLTHQARVKAIVTHSIYLDPVKKRARQNLMNLIRQISSQIQNSFSAKASKKYQIQLSSIGRNIDSELSLKDDQKVKAIYRAKFKGLKDLELKLTRKVQLNHYTEVTRKFGKRLDGMKMLADQEVRKSNEVFNRYYHKAVYKISHASSLAECQRNERLSRNAINKILVKDQAINDSKQQFYQAIETKIKQANHQIMSLTSLQKKDKHDSRVLLDQIKSQTYHNIKAALSRNQMLMAKDKSHKLVKQVIDKVSSASVLVSAIKSANSQISKSTLDKQQKDATLKQINQIIDKGIKVQFDQNQKSTRHRSVKHFTHHHHHHHHHNSGNNLDDFGLDLDKSKAKHSSFIGSIVNAFKNFFKWLRVKLAQAF